MQKYIVILSTHGTKEPHAVTVNAENIADAYNKVKKSTFSDESVICIVLDDKDHVEFANDALSRCKF